MAAAAAAPPFTLAAVGTDLGLLAQWVTVIAGWFVC